MQYSFSFEKAKARQAREKLVQQMFLAAGQLFPAIKPQLSVLKKDGQINWFTYTTIVQIFVDRAGKMIYTLAEDATLLNIGVDKAALERLCLDKPRSLG